MVTGREFNVAESNVRLWKQQNLTIFATNASRKKFTGPRKGSHPDVEVQVLEFVHERRKNGQHLPEKGLETSQGIKRSEKIGMVDLSVSTMAAFSWRI